MGTLACRMCAAPLKIDANGIYAKCIYCGMNYMLPFEDETEEEKVARAEPYLFRARMYLADGFYTEAAENYEKVLDILPWLGEAYLGKGMAQLGVSVIEELCAIKREAVKNYYIKKALIFCRGDEKQKLMEVLGMCAKIEMRNMPMMQWRSEILNTRKAFKKELLKRVDFYSTEYTEAINAIDEKYGPQTSKLRKKLNECEASISGIKDRMGEPLSMEIVNCADRELAELNREITILSKELTEINALRNREIAAVDEQFSVDEYHVDKTVFTEVAKKYPLVNLSSDVKANIVDKVYNIILATYDVLSLEDIMSDGTLYEYNEQRVAAALKKLLYKRWIISKDILQAVGYTKQSCKTVYAPIDMENIIVEDNEPSSWKNRSLSKDNRIWNKE